MKLVPSKAGIPEVVYLFLGLAASAWNEFLALYG